MACRAPDLAGRGHSRVFFSPLLFAGSAARMPWLYVKRQGIEAHTGLLAALSGGATLQLYTVSLWWKYTLRTSDREGVYLCVGDRQCGEQGFSVRTAAAPVRKRLFFLHDHIEEDWLVR